MAAAIRELYPSAKFGVGPAVDNGFYYDVMFPEPIKLEDLGKIQRLMKKIKRKKRYFVRRELSVDEALETFRGLDQPYKLELIELLRDKGSTAVAEETGDPNAGEGGGALDSVSVYDVNGFVDLCRGPHVPNTGEIGHFKLNRLAAAYWRGREDNPQLQRIYGLCFETEEELAAEIERLEQIRLRDHRRIGKELEIFHLAEEVGSGLPLWLPNGTVIRDELEHLAKERERAAGYLRVSTPHITHEALYYQSGHLPYYRDDMYAPIEIEDKRYLLRPMNCPHHHHVYLSRPRSYRDLPIRLAEYGQVYRFEKSGSLSGTMRTRGFCQNDAHIYCSVADAKDEFKSVMLMHAEYYALFGIDDFYMRLSLPDLDKLDKYVNEPEKWLAALEVVRLAMEESGLPYRDAKGEAAFYGPKIDFIIKSALGVEHAISTNQLDFLATERFGLTYTGADGGEHPVYVVHRAPLGSHERFIAFLTEHYGGRFPFWLAPIQVSVIPISDRHADYARRVVDSLTGVRVFNGSLGLRVELKEGSDRMQKKIRDATLRHIPVVLVVGDSEMEEESVSIRLRDGSDLGQVPLAEARGVFVDASEGRDESIFGKRWS